MTERTGWMVRERDGAPIYLSEQAVDEEMIVPLDAMLLDGMDVYVFTILGVYAKATIRKDRFGEMYAEDDYHIWPINYSNIERCYVTHSMISKAAIDTLKQVSSRVTGS